MASLGRGAAMRRRLVQRREKVRRANVLGQRSQHAFDLAEVRDSSLLLRIPQIELVQALFAVPRQDQRDGVVRG